jgi:hypothetical protein
MELLVTPVDQLKFVPLFELLAFSTTVSPAHIAAAGDEIEGTELTVTVAVAVLIHPFASVAVTVNALVVPGNAKTLFPVAFNKPAGGDQE